MSRYKTLTQVVLENERLLERQARASGQVSPVTGEFTALLNDIATACKQVSNLVNRGELAEVLGMAGSQNVQGEDQKKLDVIANQVFIESNLWSGRLAGLASEEMDHMYPIPDTYPCGRYLLTFDPLDGSSNIDVDGAVGTIFSILRHDRQSRPADEDFLQPGLRQVCAGYCLYSSATMLVLSTGQGVAGFTLDAAIGEFVLTHPKLVIPPDTREFAINAAYQRHWHPPVKRYVEELLAGRDGPRGQDFNMRWTGSMVGDIHRILCRGGIFMYPSDAKLAAAGQGGKLRLLYEANPMGFIVEQAGGLASTGQQRILEIVPESLHQRVPVLMGSAREVQRLNDYHDD